MPASPSPAVSSPQAPRPIQPASPRWQILCAASSADKIGYGCSHAAAMMLLRGFMFARRFSFALALAISLSVAQAQNQPLLQKRQRELRDQSEQTTRAIRELPGVYKL